MRTKVAFALAVLLLVRAGAAGEIVSVATWKGDRPAALSITDDDGNAYPIYLKECTFWKMSAADDPSAPPTWSKVHHSVGKTILDLCEEYDVRMTFFIDTRQIDDPPSMGSVPDGYHHWSHGGVPYGLQGTWDGWAEVVRRGHEVGSHTVHHMPWEWEGHSTVPVIGQIPEGWQPNPDELVVSKQRIETEISARLGSPYICRVLAWPWGRALWKETAADLYVAARGTRGWQGWAGYPGGPEAFGPTPADWYQTPSVSTGSEQLRELPQRIAQIIDTNGWYVLLNHGSVTNLENNLIALEPFRDDLWLDTYGNVAVYAQLRDALETSVTATTDGYTISLGLSHEMDPCIYSSSLTLVLDEAYEDLATSHLWQQGEKALTPYLGGKGAYCVDVDPFGPPVTILIPEPATLSLLAVGGLLLIRGRAAVAYATKR